MLTSALAAGACNRRPLPEPRSPEARLYAHRCGQCHAAYDPRSLTAAMWMRQMDLMRRRIREAGLPPLSQEERQAILGYLLRNAGTE